jgi:signal transduction histidine kinase
VTVNIASSDREVHSLCREVLSKFPGVNCNIVSSKAPVLGSSEDVFVWDFQPDDAHFPSNLASLNLHRHFFLAKLSNLGQLQESLGRTDVNIILKPVRRAILRALFRGVCMQPASSNKTSEARIASLKADRDLILQGLIQSNLRLQEYEQERTNFLARAVHDFRAPLTAIAGYCGLFLDDQLGSVTPEQKDILERMQRSAKRLSRMANAMFQLSICQNVETQLNLQDGDLEGCVQQALHEINFRVEEKRIAASISIAGSPETLQFEKAQMEQVFLNLLDNACKFTPRGGTIEVRGYPFFWERRRRPADESSLSVDRRLAQVKTPNSFRIDIRDSGPGIPPGELENIFEEFTSCSGEDRSGGGLGLAICKMILAQHQGRVWAESYSSGASFSFVLPFHRSEASPLGTRNEGGINHARVVSV